MARIKGASHDSRNQVETENQSSESCPRCCRFLRKENETAQEALDHFDKKSALLEQGGG